MLSSQVDNTRVLSLVTLHQIVRFQSTASRTVVVVSPLVCLRVYQVLVLLQWPISNVSQKLPRLKHVLTWPNVALTLVGSSTSHSV